MVSRKERKGRRDLNHEIHRIHENGRARWSHRNPQSSVLRLPCSVVRPPILCPLSSVLRRQSFPLPITNFSRVEHVERVERVERVEVLDIIGH